MSSTLVSSYIEFGERFLHEDLSTPDTMGYYIDPAAQNQKSSVFDKDLPAYSGFSTAGRPPVSRRHSSSVYSPVSTKSTQLQTLAESALLGNILTGALETVVEERYRSRAFSEGSAVLGEPLQEHQGQSGTSRYKTELCRPFEENGKCKYGDKCQFAHGKHELRHMVRHPKYKTELCRTFHTSGLCPYGPRCHFIHNQDDHAAEVQRQTSLNAKASATVPVPILGQTQRRNSTNNSSRPSNLQLLSQQRGINRLGSYSYSPTHVNSPLDAFYGVNEAALLSPISPLGKTNGQFFNYGKLQMSPPDRTNGFGMAGKSEYRQTTPPPTQFDSQRQVSESPVNDDIVFVGPPTPPDSDRESATGSPPGFGSVSVGPQRLPIFRCLSQSE